MGGLVAAFVTLSGVLFLFFRPLLTSCPILSFISDEQTLSSPRILVVEAPCSKDPSSASCCLGGHYVMHAAVPHAQTVFIRQPTGMFGEAPSARLSSRVFDASVQHCPCVQSHISINLVMSIIVILGGRASQAPLLPCPALLVLPSVGP